MMRKLPSIKFLTTLERDEDGVWIAECPSIPGMVRQRGSHMILIKSGEMVDAMSKGCASATPGTDLA